MRSASWHKCEFILALVVFALTLALKTNSQTLTTFDAPVAGKLSGEGTRPAAVNSVGTITGSVLDRNHLWHGFVRTNDARYIIFDAPRADPKLGCTCPIAINDLGIIVGYTLDSHGVARGFVRTPDGKFHVVGPRGAIRSTFLDGIDDFGVATGRLFDASGRVHAFLRNRDGKVTLFEDPLAGEAAGEGTWPNAINNQGTVSGWVKDAQLKAHGFLRVRTGDFINFDVPGAIGSLFVNAYVNDRGVVAGTYVAQQEVDHEVEAGFQRLRDGNFSVYAAPTGPLHNLSVSALNTEGTATGWYEGSVGGLDHAFVRFDDGRLVPIEFPFGEQESVGAAVNDRDVVVGWWIDSHGVYRGYTWLPASRRLPATKP
jgi:hypothetical protein